MKDMIEGERAEGGRAEGECAEGECAEGRRAEGERTEGKCAVSNGVELVDVFVVLGSPSDLGERLEDELGSDVPLADLMLS